jgi:hypothetical protein
MFEKIVSYVLTNKGKYQTYLIGKNRKTKNMCYVKGE